MPNLDEINTKIKKFIGFINQIPPKVSAVKINGERAYKLFRKSEIFKMSSRKVFVKNLEVIKHKHHETDFKIECGKGFYIRSLARDLGRNLKTFGHISLP